MPPKRKGASDIEDEPPTKAAKVLKAAKESSTPNEHSASEDQSATPRQSRPNGRSGRGARGRRGGRGRGRGRGGSTTKSHRGSSPPAADEEMPTKQLDSARAMRSKTRAMAAKTKAKMKMNTIGEDDLSAPMHLTSQADADEAFGGAMTGVLSSSAALDVVRPSQALSELDFVHEPTQSQLRTYAGRKKTRSARSGPAVDVTDNRPKEHLTKGKTTAPQAQSDVGVPGTADGDINNDSDVPTAPDEDNNSEEEEEDVQP